MTIGELNRRISILEQSEEKDSFGAVTGEWIETGRVWAKVAEKLSLDKQAEKIADGKIENSKKAVITVRFYAGLTTKHRISIDGKNYEITAIRDLNGDKRWTEVSATEILL